jgi:hypothetical protein
MQEMSIDFAFGRKCKLPVEKLCRCISTKTECKCAD